MNSKKTQPLKGEPDFSNQYLAATLRELRQQREWSLDRAAQATGVSKAMLGQIERGESSPTIATLWKIATGFETSLSSFLEPPPTPHPEILLRKATQLRRHTGDDPMQVAPLFPFEARFGFEIFELTLSPGDERYSDPHERGVTEFIIVSSGQMEVFVEGQWKMLCAGDALRFSADKPHGYRNKSDSAAVFYDVIHYPK